MRSFLQGTRALWAQGAGPDWEWWARSSVHYDPCAPTHGQLGMGMPAWTQRLAHAPLVAASIVGPAPAPASGAAE